ncbi:glycosyltransferase [uncultured Rhodospira sp.]|uniref:glycosyltransferase n=1 Tax=uncultured Rhodospira sp. TaxID=1936189 RepID=UPI002614AFD8|nr:glycosyltransferase [uncultured Rhodospira sp.]
MIFVTVGTQLPFDRLVEAVASWHRHHPDQEVFAQIGRSTLDLPFDSAQMLTPEDHGRLFDRATVVVSHVGIGTILGCTRQKKPLICMPREFRRGEHRNDHQAATANQLAKKVTLSVARTEAELHALLEQPPKTHIPELAAAEDSQRISAYLTALLGTAD